MNEPAGEATAFLQPLRRLFEAARAKYVKFGRVGGIAVLPHPTPAERDALHSLLGAPARRSEPSLKVDLKVLDQALRRSRFGDGLTQALEAIFDGLPVTREEMQATREAGWQALLDSLRPAAQGPAAPWLSSLAEGAGRGYLTVRREFNAGRPNLAGDLDLVLRAMSSLPSQPRQLAVFAAGLAGNPHALDADTLAGRLLAAGLEATAPAGTMAGLEEEDAPSLYRALLFNAVNLSVDDVSSTVLVRGLEAARTADCADPVVAAARASGAVLAYPLRQVRSWQKVAAPEVWLVENPPVFAALCDQTSAGVCLVCTSGRLSAAAVLLLDRLAQAGAKLHYSGDFDLDGISMATFAIRRFGALPWRLAPEDYLLAARGGHPQPLGEKRLHLVDQALLPTLELMREKNQAAYQESLLAELASDVQSTPIPLLESPPPQPARCVKLP